MGHHSQFSIALVVGLLCAATVPVGSADVNTSAVIGNVVPEITDISVPATVNPTAGDVTPVTITLTAADHNGFQDLDAVKVTVKKPDGSTVHIAQAAATSNGDGSGTAQTYNYTFSMKFYDDAATGTSYYHISAVAEDAASALSAPFVAKFHYAELAALSLSATSLGFGTLEPGERSATQTLGVTNKGNVQIDLQTSGTDLSDGNGHAIDQSNIKYDLAANDFSTERSLTETSHTNSDFDLAKGASSSKDSYWALDVPSADAEYLPSGTYTGAITVSAIQG